MCAYGTLEMWLVQNEMCCKCKKYQISKIYYVFEHKKKQVE